MHTCDHADDFAALMASLSRIGNTLSALTSRDERLVTLTDQLKTDLAAQTAAVEAVVAGDESILAIVQDLAAKSSGAGSVADADVQDALTQVEALTSTLVDTTAATVASAQAADPTFVVPAPTASG